MQLQYETKTFLSNIVKKGPVQHRFEYAYIFHSITQLSAWIFRCY